MDENKNKYKSVGYEIGSCSRLLHRRMLSLPDVSEGERLTGMHGWVLGYLYDHDNEDVYQKDIERIAEQRRSTTTAMLQNMEKNGLIIRSSVDCDARLKKITLTEKGRKLQIQVIKNLRDLEQDITKGMTPEEIDTYIALTQKIKNNLSENEKGSNNEESHCRHIRRRR